LQLAVETDYEFFELFGDPNAAAAYVVQLYGAISDIYVRDVNTRVELTFVRLWDNPADLFNSPDPLTPFRDHWNANMQLVVRDVAQFLTGQRTLSAGGVAYLSSLCTVNAYSWSGYVLGFFSDPARNDWMNRDIMIAAHELGHNCGTGHTHDYGLDDCDNPASVPRRGSIMAYCGQTFSGGDANHDLWFHEHTANLMRQHINSRACVADDCNSNSVLDATDISTGFSVDTNTNGVPDECEDCNGNGTIDGVDIATQASADVNNNLLPDECETDCNGNGVPDRHEISLGSVPDLNANRVPDSCEGDCDGNGTADYTQIQANMMLDKDRDVVLDSCQDCDGDGTIDLAALDHAWNLYVGTLQEPAVREYFAETGVLMNVLSPGMTPDTQDLLITPSRRVLVSSGSLNRIVELNAAGSVVGVLVAPGSGGLNLPAGMLISPSGTLLVASRGSGAVLEYDLATGAFLRAVVPPGGGGLALPFGMAVNSAGNLLVTSGGNQVLEFSITIGALVRVFVSAGSGGLSNARGMVFKPDGRLLVCSFGSNALLEYDGGTGAFLRVWNRGGTATRLTLDEPWGIRLAPDGDVYVSRSHTDDGFTPELHLTNARIYQFDIRNGNLVRAFVIGNDSGLLSPSGFDFMPGDATDCNQNRLPDSCDISLGNATDCNGNGQPDACDAPCPVSFCQQPQPLAVTVGEAAVFSVVTSADSAATYQWRRNQVELSNGGTTSGAQTRSLSISAAALGDAGGYDVVITSVCGSTISASAVMTVGPACGSADFDGDGDTGTDLDIEALFACVGGDCCPGCGSADFDGDGDAGTDLDIEAFFRVLGGGTC